MTPTGKSCGNEAHNIVIGKNLSNKRVLTQGCVETRFVYDSGMSYYKSIRSII